MTDTGLALKYFMKKLAFLALRARQDVGLYEGEQRRTGKTLRVLHSGDAGRGRYFIERLFGHLPERKHVGSRFILSPPDDLEAMEKGVDLIFVELNRLQSARYRERGYFIVPEWVEFGRAVEKDPLKRYEGASKSLKSDLNKAGNPDFAFSIGTAPDDFDRFYSRMYLPHIRNRFGSSIIEKSRGKMRKAFRDGFVFFLLHRGNPVAGALVTVGKDGITETALGVLDGADDYLKMGVSGAIDFHLHEWAARNGKESFGVGHTRSFPLDGIYRNKRKWLMSVRPDGDGVMDMGIGLRGPSGKMAGALRDYPFVFRGRDGLSVFCSCDGGGDAAARMEEAYERFNVKGVCEIVVLSADAPAGEPRGAEMEKGGVRVRLVAGAERPDVRRRPR